MNTYKAIETAERQIKRYLDREYFKIKESPHYRWLKKNCTGFKAVRAAGYLTGMGWLK